MSTWELAIRMGFTFIILGVWGGAVCGCWLLDHESTTFIRHIDSDKDSLYATIIRSCTTFVVTGLAITLLVACWRVT